MSSKRKYKHTTARQVGGDDGYCWAVFVNGRERVNGLTRREVTYYRERFEREEEARLAAVHGKQSRGLRHSAEDLSSEERDALAYKLAGKEPTVASILSSWSKL